MGKWRGEVAPITRYEDQSARKDAQSITLTYSIDRVTSPCTFAFNSTQTSRFSSSLSYTIVSTAQWKLTSLSYLQRLVAPALLLLSRRLLRLLLLQLLLLLLLDLLRRVLADLLLVL